MCGTRRMLRPLVRAHAPRMLLAAHNSYAVHNSTAYTPRGKDAFRAFLDVAVLAIVDDCYAASHMGKFIDAIRGSWGKPRCVRPAK